MTIAGLFGGSIGIGIGLAQGLDTGAISGLGVAGGLLAIGIGFVWRQMLQERAEARADLAAANKRNDDIQEARLADQRALLDRLTVPGGTSTRDSHA